MFFIPPRDGIESGKVGIRDGTGSSFAQKFRDGMPKIPGFSGRDGIGTGRDRSLVETAIFDAVPNYSFSTCAS